jgi:LPXTG-motif cell wall-anchored protein
VPVRPQALAAFAVLIALALPGAAVAQSAGDEQYTDPFGQGDAPAQQQDAPAQQQDAPAPQQAPAPEQPVEQAPVTPEPAPGGNGTVGTAQDTSPSLPRTGAPVVLFAAIGYALLLAGIAIRRKS